MKIIMTDVDGTISFGDNKVSKETIESMNKFKAQNEDNVLILATGRNISAINFLEQLEEIKADYFILCNGAAILDKDLKVLYVDKMDEHIEEICEILGGKFRIDTLTEIYFSESYDFSSNFPVDIVNHIESYKEINDDIVVVNGRMDNEEVLANAISKLEKLNVQINRNNTDLDVQKKGVNKATGIDKLASLKKYDNYDVYAIGDSFNDIEMIKTAKIGATFTYAKDEIKQISDIVVENFSEFVEVVIND